jgi:inward rectifier potassium channel
MSIEEERDLGFGSVVARESRMRLLNRDGSFNVVRDGLGFFQALNPYHSLLTMSWPAFLTMLTASYLLINALFAVAFLLCGPGALQSPPTGAPEGRFLQAFFFSVETFATIGYGNIYPIGAVPNMLMTLESLIGLLGVALATGIIFARFSRPNAQIRFSNVAVIAPYRGITAFEFRIANERSSQIVQLEAKVLFTRFEPRGGVETRQFYDLELERRRVVFFPLAWTIVHPIDAHSPLYGLSRADLLASDAEVLVLLTGFDETFSQTVHTRSSYKASEIIWNARFRNMFNPPTLNGILSIDMGKLHHIEQLAETAIAAD